MGSVREDLARWDLSAREGKLISIAEGGDKAARSSSLQLAFKLFSATAIVFLAGKAAQVGMHALLAQQLGPELFGQISVALSVGQILAIVLTVGVPVAAMRFVAGLAAAKDWAALRGYLFFASVVVLSGAALGALGSLVYFFQVSGIGERNVAAMLVMLLPLLVVTASRAAVMRGMEKITSALLPWEVVAPVVTILCLLFFPQTDALAAAALVAMGIAVGEVVGIYFLLTSLPPEIRNVQARFKSKQWLAVSIPTQAYQVGRLVIERADVVLVGFFLGFTAAGLYAVAHRLSMVLNLLVRISSSIVSPQLARSFHAEGRRNLFSLSGPVVALTLVAGGCTYLLLFLTAEPLVTLFGVTGASQVEETILVLLVLALGQYATALTAPFSQALVMTRYERIAMLMSSSAAVALVAAFAVVLPLYGLIGGAIVKAVLTGCMNVATVLVAWRKLEPRKVAPS